MNAGMSSALTRKVWRRTTSAIVQSAASTMARTFSKACRVWLPTSGPAVGRAADLRAGADGAVEAAMGQPQLHVDAVLADDAVPAIHAALAVGHVVVAQPLVERGQRRLLGLQQTILLQRDDPVRRVLEQVIVGLLGLL